MCFEISTQSKIFGKQNLKISNPINSDGSIQNIFNNLVNNISEWQLCSTPDAHSMEEVGLLLYFLLVTFEDCLKTA